MWPYVESLMSYRPAAFILCVCVCVSLHVVPQAAQAVTEEDAFGHTQSHTLLTEEPDSSVVFFCTESNVS